MVQILRDQMRNVTPDMSDANRLAEGARVFSDWGTMFKKAGSLANQFNAEQKKEQLEIEKADQNMIDTQIGGTLANKLMRENAEKIASGVDPNTDEYNQWLESERERIFQPYIDQMQSDKGRAAMQKMARDTTDKLVASNIGKIAKNRKSAQAQAAYLAAGNQMKNDAFEFGKLGDFEGYQDAVKSQRDAMIKYAKKAGGEPAAAQAEFQIDYNSLVNYLGGYAESDPETVVNMFEGDEEGQAKLRDIVPESVLNAYTKSYEKAKKAEKYQLQERLKTLPQGSDAYKSVQKKIKEVEGQIASPEDGAYEELKGVLAQVVLPEAKRNLEKARQAAKEMEEKYQVKTFLATISPDSQERFNARAKVAPETKAVQYLDNLVNDKETKGVFAKLKKAYNDMKDATKDVIKTDPVTQTDQKVKYEASEAAALALNKALADTDMPDIERLTNGLEAIAELKKTPGITEQQMEKFQNILHAGLNDRIFGGMASEILQGGNRYFPDTSWLSNIINPMSYKSDMQLTMMGMPSKDIEDTDVDTVKNYLQANAIRITDTAINMIDQAAQQPTTQARQAAMQDVANWVASEKEKVYNTAMKNYGIDLERLREEKRKTGRAFTQIGFQVKEYMGDTPDGQPIFETNMSSDMASAVRKRIMDGLEASKAKGEK